MNKRHKSISQFFGGQAFFEQMTLSHVKFVIYVFILIIFYISFHYASEKTLLRVRVTEKEVKALRAEYTGKHATLMFLSQQKEVERQLREKRSELHAPAEPPQWIKEACYE